MRHAPHPHWLKSSFSGDGGNNCIELAATRNSGISLRESESPATAVTTNRTALRALLRHIKARSTEPFHS
ncbi:DUF397 domain-containing protein [Streptomyces sp. NPDC050617]|uniref:DUF397 domain-containing protein n=1 Tax=Streptomyces sp. NPDC050617 TaxID=3154628 RepID=UPI0034136D96